MEISLSKPIVDHQEMSILEACGVFKSKANIAIINSMGGCGHDHHGWSPYLLCKRLDCIQD